MKRTPVIITVIICATVLLLAAVGAYVFVNMQNQQRLHDQSEQNRNDKVYSECLQRTAQEGYWSDKGGDKVGCQKDPIGR